MSANPDHRTLHLFPNSESWTKAAACKGKPTEWWFSLWLNDTPMPAGMRRALTTCFRCPVRKDCLAHALGRPGGEGGIWGGTLESWRRGKNITDLDQLHDESYGYARQRGFTYLEEES